MAASSFGGIKSSGAVGRFGVAAAGPSASSMGPAAPIGRGSRGYSSPGPAGSPYSTAEPGTIAAPATHHALLILVGLEALVLVALRGGFRHHHGG